MNIKRTERCPMTIGKFRPGQQDQFMFPKAAKAKKDDVFRPFNGFLGSRTNRWSKPGPLCPCHPFAVFRSIVIGLLLLTLVATPGCSPREYLEGEDPQEDAIARNDPNAEGSSDSETNQNTGNPNQPNENIKPSMMDTGLLKSPSASDDSLSRNGSRPRSRSDGATDIPALTNPSMSNEAPGDTNMGAGGSTSNDDDLASQLEQSLFIKSDAEPELVTDRLGVADQLTALMRMQPDPNRSPSENRSRLIGVLQQKRSLARQLIEHPDASLTQKLLGQRGQIQALSGLASLGLASEGSELIQAALAASESSSVPLAIDGWNVLISDATARYSAGNTASENDILTAANAINDLLTTNQVEQSIGDAINTMMALGRARQTLARFDDAESAAQVRDVITKLYAKSPNEKLASLAAEMSGRFADSAVSQLAAKLVDGQPVTVDQWQSAIDDVLLESADLPTVQNLGKLAIQATALQHRDLADVVYTSLRQRFEGSESAAAQEAMIACDAAERRQSLIGTLYNPNSLPADDGRSLSIRDFRGRIVLIPFWSPDLAETASLLPELEKIQADHPSDVAIVGVRLDLQERRVIRSEQSESIPPVSSLRSFVVQPDDVSTILKQVGNVAFPFVIILDQAGAIVDFGFEENQIARRVDSLVEK